MERSSIHLSAATRRRLSPYRASGMSYEEVLRLFMDALPAKEFLRRLDTARRQAARALLRPASAPSDAAEEARQLREAETAALTPGERMERAFRLRELLRGGG